jgi:restriction system protein
MDITYHYPPELFELLVSAIPILGRSKKAVLLFFRGSGVSESMLSDLTTKVQTNKEAISKFEIARTVLQRLNEKGEITLKERREILKRVTTFEDFSVCWEDDQFKAKGLVADIRKIVNVKDSFTRLHQELEKERQKRQQEYEEKVSAKRRKKEELLSIKSDLFSLFGMTDPQKRGKFLEGVLNRFFALNGILIREAFTLVSDGHGIVEQIDGVIEIDGVRYLVEMKWWQKPLGAPEVAPHLVRVYGRGHAGGLIISNSGFTDAAIQSCKEALAQKVIILCELHEMVLLLDQEGNIKDFFKRKIDAAVIDKSPFFKPLDSNR